MKNIVGKKFRHFKGKEYIVLCIAKDCNSMKDMVVYQSVSKVLVLPDNHYGLIADIMHQAKCVEDMVFVRSYEDFVSEVDKFKYPDVTQKYRFEQIGD